MNIYTAIDGMLESRKVRLLNGVRYKTITNLLNRTFKLFPNFKFLYVITPNIPPDDLSVGGAYDYKKNIKYIIFSFNNELDNIIICEDQWVEIKFLILQTCVHEHIHQLQFSRKKIINYEYEKIDFRNLIQNEDDDIAYLADKDEIDAYAHDLALEILRYYNKFNPYEVLNSLKSKRYCWTYKYYNKTFKGQDWFCVKKRLLKKTFLWLQRMHNKDLINA